MPDGLFHLPFSLDQEAPKIKKLLKLFSGDTVYNIKFFTLLPDKCQILFPKYEKYITVSRNILQTIPLLYIYSSYKIYFLFKTRSGILHMTQYKSFFLNL